MTIAARLDVVRRAARSPLAGALERTLLALGVGTHGTLLVAASGGADSTALLLLAAAVSRRRGWRIEAATVDHHLRANSHVDAAGACATAAAIGVACTLLHVHPEGGAGAPARARHERYRALAEHARSRGLRAVVTAHHARDQLETMLMAITRGAGVRAAGGMTARRRLAAGVSLLRPLLEVRAERLPALCRALAVPWSHDPSNDDARSLRVRLRRCVIPELEACRCDASVRAAILAKQLRAAGRREQSRARRLVAAMSSTIDGGAALDRSKLLAIAATTRRQMVHQILTDLDAKPSARLLLAIDAALVDDGRHARVWRVPGGATIALSAQRLSITAAGTSPGCATRRTRSGHR